MNVSSNRIVMSWYCCLSHRVSVISLAMFLKHIIRTQLTFFVEASGEEFLGRLSSRLAVQQHTRAAIASNRHSIFLFLVFS
jgi:hypothetical protein